jgi:hypothetical protein
MAKNQRKYTDREKAAALAFLDFNAGNVKKSATALKIPERTLNEWANNRGVNEDVATSRDDKKEELSALIEQAVRDMIGASAGKLTGANFQQLWTGVGIAVDKMQLLKGEPTNITKELLADAERERIKGELRRGLQLVKKGA